MSIKSYFEQFKGRSPMDMRAKVQFTQNVKKECGMYGLASEYAACGGVWEKWKLADLNSSLYGREYTKSILTVNKAIKSSDNELMSFFRLNDGGRVIPVKIERCGVTTRIESRWDDDGVKDPLGVYRYKAAYEKDQNTGLGISYTKDREIILYADKIEDFARRLGASLAEVIAYVLVHEVFHAYQDFHLNFTEYQTNHKPDDIEPYAEYYALRFVKNVLKDKDLFERLCHERSVNWLSPYSEALNMFGDIRFRQSEENYFKELAGNVRLWGYDDQRYDYFS